jgi:hypothetical protein
VRNETVQQLHQKMTRRFLSTRHRLLHLPYRAKSLLPFNRGN